MAGTENGFRTPFGDITQPKKRENSEPPSLNACARAVSFGPSHPTHDQPPVRTIAAASLMTSTDETYRFTEDTAVHKFHYPLPKLIVLGILGGALRIMVLCLTRALADSVERALPNSGKPASGCLWLPLAASGCRRLHRPRLHALLPVCGAAVQRPS